ncbi:MAG: segregation/condensation protein A [Myxococcota bacterium]
MSARASAAASSAYSVKLPAFEGPLDLLLHLIRINEVEITDLPIARIAEQYLDYLDLLHELNLDSAGEYLVMSATLAWIKSRMLLPPDPDAIEGGILDPRAELIARLVEYQRFKEAASSMGERPLLDRDVYAANAQDLEPVPDAERKIEVGVFQLVEAFRQALARAGPVGFAHEVEADPVTVHDRMVAVMEILDTCESCDFARILEDEGVASSRPVVVASFLAILELARLQALGVYQGVDAESVPIGPIHLRRRVEAQDGAWKQLISNVM